jgi:hypothetical protein
MRFFLSSAAAFFGRIRLHLFFFFSLTGLVAPPPLTPPTHPHNEFKCWKRGGGWEEKKSVTPLSFDHM